MALSNRERQQRHRAKLKMRIAELEQVVAQLQNPSDTSAALIGNTIVEAESSPRGQPGDHRDVIEDQEDLRCELERLVDNLMYEEPYGDFAELQHRVIAAVVAVPFEISPRVLRELAIDRMLGIADRRLVANKRRDDPEWDDEL